MKSLHKSTKTLLAFILTLILSFSMNAIPVSAATIIPNDTIATRTVIPSWGDITISGGNNPHYSSGFGIRDNQSVKLNVTIIYRTGDYPLKAMVYTRDGNTLVASADFYSSGTHTFSIPGGSYFIAFNTRAGKVKFNYTITV